MRSLIDLLQRGGLSRPRSGQGASVAADELQAAIDAQMRRASRDLSGASRRRSAATPSGSRPRASRSARSTACRSSARRPCLREPEPHHGPHPARPRRGHRHRARSGPGRPAPFQGRADPGRLPRRPVRRRRAAVAARPVSSSSSPTAGSTATAPPRPSFTPLVGAGRGADPAIALPSPDRSISMGASRPSAASTRRSRASSTSAGARSRRRAGRADSARNVKHLMLREDVVAAAAEGRFQVIPVA